MYILSIMNNAIILIIGNEILSGRTLDQNANFIATRCSKIGINLEEIRIIPDKISIIKKVVLEGSKKYKYVFVTGGIGPTHDDVTTLAISLAFKRKLILNKKQRAAKNYYKSSIELNDSRMKMAYLKGFKHFEFSKSAPGLILKMLGNGWSS